MEPIKNLKKLKGEEKKSYLNNLSTAVNILGETIQSYEHMRQNFCSLIQIIGNSAYVEVDCSTGMPSTPSILGVNAVKKNIERELDELRSKISSGVKESDGKSLEQMLVKRVKSKIYSFDTFTAEGMQLENAPFHEILNTELALRDRLYFLSAVRDTSPFSLDVGIAGRLVLAGEGLYGGNFELIGFNPCQNRLTSYNFKINFPPKNRKKLFWDAVHTKGIEDLKIFSVRCEDTHFRFKDKYEELLKKNFLAGDIDSMYSAVSQIKHLWLAEVSRLTFDFYHDKNTGCLEDLKRFFEDCPEAFVFNVSEEKVVALEDHSKDFKKNRATDIEKSKIIYKICPEEFVQNLREFYKGDKSIKVL